MGSNSNSDAAGKALLLCTTTLEGVLVSPMPLRSQVVCSVAMHTHRQTVAHSIKITSASVDGG